MLKRSASSVRLPLLASSHDSITSGVLGDLPLTGVAAAPRDAVQNRFLTAYRAALDAHHSNEAWLRRGLGNYAADLALISHPAMPTDWHHDAVTGQRWPLLPDLLRSHDYDPTNLSATFVAAAWTDGTPTWQAYVVPALDEATRRASLTHPCAAIRYAAVTALPDDAVHDHLVAHPEQAPDLLTHRTNDDVTGPLLRWMLTSGNPDLIGIAIARASDLSGAIDALAALPDLDDRLPQILASDARGSWRFTQPAVATVADGLLPFATTSTGIEHLMRRATLTGIVAWIATADVALARTAVAFLADRNDDRAWAAITALRGRPTAEKVAILTGVLTDAELTVLRIADADTCTQVYDALPQVSRGHSAAVAALHPVWLSRHPDTRWRRWVAATTRDLDLLQYLREHDPAAVVREQAAATWTGMLTATA